MIANEPKVDYLLHLADNALILGQRLGEWCGHGPVLEQDMAMTNIALDYLGRARLLFQYAAELKQDQSTEDTLAFMRNEWDYKNVLLTEYPNVDFAFTVCRQFFLDAFQHPYFTALSSSKDSRIAEIAAKTVKETAYHLKWSGEWIIRLGDGTQESKQKIQNAIDELWSYTGELFMPSDYENKMIAENIAVDPVTLSGSWHSRIDAVLKEAGLIKPTAIWMQSGGKTGKHTEHLGYILAEMQYMQRAYPGMEW